MGEIVNLNKARKARTRSAARTQAASNRVLHGRTRIEREATAAERDRASRLLDGAKRHPDED